MGGASSLVGSSASSAVVRAGLARGVGVAVEIAAGGAAMRGGSMAGGVTIGTGTGVLAVGVGVGDGAGRRDSGTSGATGPCRSGGCCVSLGAGRRKSLTAAPAGAARRAELKARKIERIVVAADMAGRAE